MADYAQQDGFDASATARDLLANISQQTRSESPRPNDTFKVNLFLLAKHLDFIPPEAELERLTRNDLGPPRKERPGPRESGLRKTLIPVTYSMDELDNLIISLYPEAGLNLIAFGYGKENKRRIEILQPTSVFHLRHLMGRKEKLFLIPETEIQLPLRREDNNTARKRLYQDPGTSSTNNDADVLSYSPIKRQLIAIESTYEDLTSKMSRLKEYTRDLLKILQPGRGHRRLESIEDDFEHFINQGRLAELLNILDESDSDS